MRRFRALALHAMRAVMTATMGAHLIGILGVEFEQLLSLLVVKVIILDGLLCTMLDHLLLTGVLIVLVVSKCS
jgi:hypothetical protein